MIHWQTYGMTEHVFTPALWYLDGPGPFDMCDVLTSLCGTIEPLWMCQLINFNFAMLHHLHTLFMLLEVFLVSMHGSSLMPFIAGM